MIYLGHVSNSLNIKYATAPVGCQENLAGWSNPEAPLGLFLRRLSHRLNVAFGTDIEDLIALLHDLKERVIHRLLAHITRDLQPASLLERSFYGGWTLDSSALTSRETPSSKSSGAGSRLTARNPFSSKSKK